MLICLRFSSRDISVPYGYRLPLDSKIDLLRFRAMEEASGRDDSGGQVAVVHWVHWHAGTRIEQGTWVE